MSEYRLSTTQIAALTELRNFNKLINFFLYKYDCDVTPMHEHLLQHFKKNVFLTVYGGWSRLSYNH